jgi:cytidine deaminase
MEREALIQMARQAAKHAYAPYSHFRVGAAVVVQTPEGVTVVTGANVENASYGLTLCAERAALAAACMLSSAADQPTVTQVAISCIDAPAGGPPATLTPCGACRQWLAELAPDAVYYVDGIDSDLHLADLLPNAFRLVE